MGWAIIVYQNKGARTMEQHGKPRVKERSAPIANLTLVKGGFGEKGEFSHLPTFFTGVNAALFAAPIRKGLFT